jgi:signal transduction histidine kinase
MRRFGKHFQTCFDQIRDPLLIVDTDGNIRRSNSAARSALDLGDAGRIADVAWLDRRVAFDGEAILQLLKGPAPAVGRRLQDPEGNETDVVLDIIDLSGKKSASRLKLIHIKDYSPYMNYERWKDELMSMVAHEIKNPLSAMKNSMNGLASHAADAMTEGQRSLLGVSLRSIDRLTRLLDNVLDVSRVRSGTYTPEPRWIEAREFTAEVIGTFKTLFNVHRQRLTCSVSGELGRIYADGPKLEQILINLLTNAVKFTPEGGEVTVEVESAGLEVLGDDLRILPWGDVAELRFVRFTITDQGIGMTEDALSHLFTRHYREESGGKPKGSHLGLSISKALVDVHNGSIEVRSELGVGTRVTVSLPADETTFTLLGRVRSIDRVLATMLGSRRSVVCHVFDKNPSLPWDRVIGSTGSNPVVNPAVREENTSSGFLWTLSERRAVALVTGEAGDRDRFPGVEEERRSRSRFEGFSVTSRRLSPRDARVAVILARAFREVEEHAEVR